jgi:hypothetical protein
VIASLTAYIDQDSSLQPKKLVSSGASRVIVPVIGTYTQIAARNASTCGLRTDGTIRCWAHGETSLEKKAATGVFTSIAATEDHTCALRSDGAIECWGNTSYGQAPSVVTPPAGKSFIDVTVGSLNSCATRSDGVIQCWGQSNWGQSPPTRTAANGLFTAVATNGASTCGLTSSGVMECFGFFGDFIWHASTGDFTRMVVGPDICGIDTSGVVECHASYEAGGVYVPMSGSFIDYEITTLDCGITAGGSVQCRGDNRYGEAPPTVTASRGRYTQLAIGAQHGCALRTDGGIDCWGFKSYGAFETLQP